MEAQDTNKPNCWKCEHRGKVAGSAHISCHHPEVKAAGIHDNPMLGMASIFGSVGRTPPVMIGGLLGVEGNPHGVANGWFQWPMNFDPTWLLKCEGFSPKETHPTPEG